MILDLNILQDILLVILAPFLGYIIKFFYKPSNFETKLITRILAFFIGVLIKYASKNKETKIHLQNINEEVIKLKQKIYCRKELG